MLALEQMLKKYKIIALIFLFAVSTAQADWLIEPYAGAGVSSSGKGDWTTPGGATGSSEHDTGGGMLYGARIGYTYTLFMLGMDFSTWSGDLETKMPAIAYSAQADVNHGTTGFFVGVQLPILFRFWGGFYNSEIKKSGEKIKGDGTALGVGYTGFPFISINGELRNFKYDKYTLNSVIASRNLGELKELKEYFVSVSIPLEF